MADLKNKGIKFNQSTEYNTALTTYTSGHVYFTNNNSDTNNNAIILEGKMNNNSKMVVIGIGININQTNFDEEINLLTTSLKKELCINFDIDLLIKELSNILINEIDKYLNGNTSYIEYIKSNLFGINILIEFTRNDVLCEGIILGIHTDGRLIVKEKDQILYVNSGEIKIKR